MIHSFRERRRVRKVFERLVRPETVEAVLRGDRIERQPFTAAHVEFVLAFVDGQTPEEISDRVGRVCDIAMSHGGVVHNMVGALVVIAFGTLPAGSPTAGKREALVEHLKRELSSFVKIVHGAADGHCGLIGSEKRMAYSILIPGFDAMLGRLSQLKFGQVEEFEG